MKTPHSWKDKVLDFIPMGLDAGIVSESDIEDWEDSDRFLYRIHNDFKFFRLAVYVDRGLYRKAPQSVVEQDMADFLACGPANMELHECRLRLLLAFRGIGKTHDIAALSCFRLRRDKFRQIFIVSKSQGEVKKTVKMTRNWLENVWFLNDLCPGPDQRDAATYFDVGGIGTDLDRQPSMSCVGITGQLEGNRGMTVIYDDGETKGNTKTLEARKSLKAMFNEATNICYPYLPHDKGGPVDPTEIIAVGTPKHEETVYAELIKQGWVCQSYPIAYPSEDQKVMKLAPILQQRLDRGEVEPGDPVLPMRFGPGEVAQRVALGHTEFSREFMLMADLGQIDLFPLRLSNFIVTSVHRDVAPIHIAYGTSNHNGSTAIPDDEIESRGLSDDRLYRPIYVDKDNWQPYTGTRAGIDPAGRGKDRTGLAIGSHLAGMIWVHRVLGLPGGLEDEEMRLLVGYLRDFNVRVAYLEDNIDVFGAFQTTLEVEIKRQLILPGDDPLFPTGWSCKVERVSARGQKEVRIIDTVEPLLSTKRIVIDDSVVKGDIPFELENDFQYQLTRLRKIPKCLPEDGKIDAFATMLQGWINEMRLVPEIAAGKKEKRVLEDQLRELKAFFGKRVKSMLTRPASHRRLS